MCDYTYLGPYVKATTNLVNSSKIIRICTNDQCPGFKFREESFNLCAFCSDCGGAIGKLEIPIEVSAVNHWEISKQIDEALCIVECSECDPDPDPAHIWMPNRQLEGIDRTISYHNAPTVNPVEHEDRGLEIVQFKTQFDEELRVLLEAYESIEIKWGVIFR